jgi:hypothetical protein
MSDLKKGIIIVLVILSVCVIASSYSTAVDTLLSQGKTATASTYQAQNTPAKGNDGSASTRWAASSATYPQWWKVDLGAGYNLTRVDIAWYSSSNRAYKYKIEVSNDDSTYTTVVDKTGNTTYGDTSDSFTASGRYVRITVTACSAGGAFASFSECKVYGGSSDTTITPIPPTVTPTPTPTGTSWPVPGKIEAENYSAMSGVQTEACSEGTQDVGWIDTGDWMNYNVNIQTAYAYQVDLRISSPNTTGQIQFKLGSTVLNTTLVPNTGGWQSWLTISATIQLPAGSQTLQLYAGGGGFNINWMNFSILTITPTPVVSPTMIPEPSPILNIQINTVGGGPSVSVNPPGTTVSSNSSFSYQYGTVVNLTANNYTDSYGGQYVFSSWSGDLSGSQNPTTITMSGNKTVVANFAHTEPPPTLPPTITPTPRPLTPTPTSFPSFPKTTWYLFNQSVGGVTPAGENMQTSLSGVTGWQPTKKITTSSSYWYSPGLSGVYNLGAWSLILWSNNPGSSSQITVELYRVNPDGGTPVLLGSQTLEAGTSGAGNHSTTFSFNVPQEVYMQYGQRLMLKITKASGADLTICYNANDFPTRLITPGY